MPLGFTVIERGVAGNLRYVAVDVAFDSSYPNTGTRATSGEPFVPGDLALDSFRLVLCEQRAGYTFDYDYTNRRLHAFRAASVAARSHASGAVDAHAVTQPAAHATHPHSITTVGAAGGGGALTEPAAAGPFESGAGGQANPNAVAADAGLAHVSLAVGAHVFTQPDNHAAVTEAALAEVANTTDLSTVLAQVRVFVLGV